MQNDQQFSQRINSTYWIITKSRVSSGSQPEVQGSQMLHWPQSEVAVVHLSTTVISYSVMGGRVPGLFVFLFYPRNVENLPKILLFLLLDHSMTLDVSQCSVSLCCEL